ncbi:ATP-binding protein [Mesorhizobium australicum]|uniref:ATP-binding protein n=1 Tax=Mesorhizobium australicum TaxID=536018 RepID=UPI00333615CA
MSRVKNQNNNRTLATGGGNATASGVSFQASVAALLAGQAVAGISVDRRFGLGAAKPGALRFETEAPVDDILVELNTGGWVFVQAKNSLANQSDLTSELGKTCDEFVRLWELTANGTGKHGWDRPLQSGKDALVIAVGPTSSGPIKNDLPQALNMHRSGSGATMNNSQRTAVANVRALIDEAIAERGAKASFIKADEILNFMHVAPFDFGGADRSASEACLANVLTLPSAAPAAFAVLERECERRMATRDGISTSGLRAELARSGVAVKAPLDFQADVAALRDKSARVSGTLLDFESTQVGGIDVTIDRTCTAACVAAAEGGSFVVVGDPGSGKSAVINETARRLKAQGKEVVLLAVDRLQVETLEGLSGALGIEHTLHDVLDNWPGSGPAFLLLDALDACRFGKCEALFRTVMQDVLQLDGKRWHVIASIRSFDLLVGQEFGSLFRGSPPDLTYVDRQFLAVRHIRVPEWSDAEFDDLLVRLPALRTAVEKGGQKLADLARVPFNTRLLADLLTAGATPEDFKNLGSQVQLLDLYWNKRVRPIGAGAEQCLRNTVTSMIGRGRMETSRISAGANTADALDQLQRAGVLIPVNGERDVAFRHHILFDYVASRAVIDIDDIPATQQLMRSSQAGLLLAPALSFTLQHLWENSGDGRPRFWEAIALLAGDPNSDPIARTVAARSASDFPRIDSDLNGLLALMNGKKPDLAFNSLRHIIGSLAVRLEDEREAVPAGPWCYLAEGLAPYVDKIAWPLKNLLISLIDRVGDNAGE